MEQEIDVQAKRDLMYGELDLSSLSLFSGSFINYGYWGEVAPGRDITLAERTASQAELYRQTLARIPTPPGVQLLEIGCGIGVGTALVAREYAAYVTGLDRSKAQLARAADANAEALERLSGRLSFQEGSATELPFPDDAFDGAYSVEALQHVDDLAAVAREARRVIRPGGHFAAATFFAPAGSGEGPLADLLETVASGVDVVHSLGAFTADLEQAGFADVAAESIGGHVWHQFDRWVAQTEYKDSWGRNLLRCYENGWLDYYVVTAS
ncbi:MAG: class I SAM-dependent methyltransferase [Glycomyces artemisiae]|uniref:Class I SAM-dependent methyltransferase n=1 Tax=Glycomyces artemisiae TaxID=1076443 RepID=A0A850CBZ8_9ACTN|nr:class I SAM-dependent methyltransferase [Glycomyces artemisiae]